MGHGTLGAAISGSGITLERLDHLVLTVRDIEASCRFYETVLGMRRESFGEGRLFTLGPEPLHLPMRSVTERDEFPLVLRGLLDDLRNACGLSHVEQFEIDLSTTR